MSPRGKANAPEREVDIERVLVTGAAGFIGSHTCDQLLARGRRVLAVDDLSTGHRGNLAAAEGRPGFELREADASDPVRMGELFEDFRPHSVIHLAALVSVPLGEREPARNFRSNVAATQVVADAARAWGAGRITFASSAAVYGNPETLPLDEGCRVAPISQYGTSKLISEQLLQAYERSYGLAATCFRFFNVYGPRQDPSSPYSGVVSLFADRYRRRRGVTVHGDGTQTRDFVFVKDVAAAVARAATEHALPGGVYNLCSGEATTLLDLVEILKKRYPRRPGAHARRGARGRHKTFTRQPPRDAAPARDQARDALRRRDQRTARRARRGKRHESADPRLLNPYSTGASAKSSWARRGERGRLGSGISAD